MKRLLRCGLLALALACALFALAVVSSADGIPEYGDTPFLGVDSEKSDFDTPLIPLNAVWQVTHDNGYKEYSSTFLGGFELVREGSVMKLLPNYLSVNIASTFTVPTNTKYTIDFGDSTIVLTNGDIREPALLFEGENDVTVLSNGARVFLQEATSAFMSFRGSSRLTVFGGEGKLSVWAPDALELGDNAHAELHDVYFYKNHGNMRAVLGVRGNSSAELYDSLLFTEQNRVAILTQGGGKVTLTDTSIISADNTNILDFEGDNISFTALGECYFYGKLTGTPKNLTLSGDIYTNFAVKDEYLAQGHSVVETQKTRSFATSKFSAPDQSVDFPVTASFTSRVLSLGVLTDSREDNSIWRIDNAEGQTVGYTDNFHYPFRTYELSAGTRLTLLCDVVESSTGLTVILEGDLTVDLGENRLLLDPDGSFGSTDALFSFDGEGRVSLLAENSRIIFDSEGTLLQLDGYVSASVSFGDSFHLINRLATAVRGDVTVIGGVLSAADGLIESTYGSVALDGTCIVTEKTQPISVGGALALTDSLVMTDSGRIVCDSLSVDSTSAVCGEIVANTVSAEAGARFSGVFGGRTDFFLRDGELELVVSRLDLVDGDLALSEASYRLCSVAASTEGGIMANMTLAGSATLNVYIPTYVKNGTDSVTVRIVHDGLVYSEGTVNSKKTVDGVEYYVYTYPYIYHNTLLESTRVDLICDGIFVRAETSPKELILSSLAVCEDEETLRGAVAYLSFALLASDDPDITSALLPYTEYLSRDRAEYPPPEGGECLRTVYFNSDSLTLDFYLRDGVEIKALRFSYGGKEMSAVPDDGGVVRIPMFRLDCREDVRILVKGDERDTLVSLNIVELYALVSASPSRSAELLGRYLAYLSAI